MSGVPGPGKGLEAIQVLPRLQHEGFQGFPVYHVTLAVTVASLWATAGFTAKKRLASPRMIAAVRRFMRVSSAAMPTARPCGALMAFFPDPGRVSEI